MKITSKKEMLPVYEVEFILAERRMADRCSSLQRFNEVLTSGERRSSLGRREKDWESYCSGPFPRRLSDLKKRSKVGKAEKLRSSCSKDSVALSRIWPFFGE